MTDALPAPSTTPSLADFSPGDVVQHVFWGRYATVDKIGRKYLHLTIHLAGTTTKWLPTSVRKVKDAS